VVRASDCHVRTKVVMTLQAVVFIASATAIYNLGHGRCLGRLSLPTSVEW